MNFFEDIFGGSSEPPTPRQLMHGRHPLYPVILGFPNGLIPTEESAGTKICGDPHPDTTPPLQSEYNGDLWNGFTQQDNRCTVPSLLGGNAMNNNPCILGCCKVHDNCYKQHQCNWSSWICTDGGIPPILPCWACNDTVVNCITGCLKK
ncbi:MAG TPA: hypothetical protein VIO10_13580 [Candidatus Binatus sp.]